MHLSCAQVSLSVPDYVAKYENLEAGEQLTDVVVSLAGEARRRSPPTVLSSLHRMQRCKHIHRATPPLPRLLSP